MVTVRPGLLGMATGTPRAPERTPTHRPPRRVASSTPDVKPPCQGCGYPLIGEPVCGARGLLRHEAAHQGRASEVEKMRPVILTSVDRVFNMCLRKF